VQGHDILCPYGRPDITGDSFGDANLFWQLFAAEAESLRFFF